MIPADALFLVLVTAGCAVILYAFSYIRGFSRGYQNGAEERARLKSDIKQVETLRVHTINALWRADELVGKLERRASS